MATFDAQAILDAVDAGAAPAIWRVYRARKSYFLVQGSTLWFLALVVLLVTIGMTIITVLSFLVPSSLATDDMAGLRYLFLLVLPLAGVFVVMSIRQGYSLMSQTAVASSQVLVLTPDGFVARLGRQVGIFFDPSTNADALAWSGTTRRRVYAVAYDALRNVVMTVDLANHETNFTLGLTFKSPDNIGTRRWVIDQRFPSRDTIAQSIIEAHARYTATHAETQ